MGTIGKVLSLLIAAALVCIAADSGRRKLIAPRPASAISGPTLDGLLFWGDTTMLVTNSSGDTPPADEEVVYGWGNRLSTNLAFGRVNPVGYAPIFYEQGGPTNGTRLHMVPYSTEPTVVDNSQMECAQPFTFFLVVKFLPTNATADRWIMDSISGTLSKRSQCKWYRNSSLAGISLSAGTEIIGETNVSVGQWFLLTVQYDGADSFIRTNGVEYVRGDAGNNTLGGWYLGFDRNRTRGTYTDIAEFLIYSNSSALNLTATETYLKSKHGL